MDTNVALDFHFSGVKYNRENKTIDNQEILLAVEFFDIDIPEHHLFLNEARLSAIAIAIYLSSILIQPESDLKILALDDMLIGLDMSNRLPVLDILYEYFPEHQIFLMTYDKAWYEIVKQRTSDAEWEYAEFYSKQTDEYEIPIHVQDKPYLEKRKRISTTTTTKPASFTFAPPLKRLSRSSVKRRNSRSDTAKTRKI